MDNKSPIRIAFAAGGTGGHVFPSIATALAVRRARADAALLFIGRETGMERDMAAEADIPYAAVTSAPFPSKSPIAIAKFLWRMGQGTRQAKRVLREFAATAVMGAGGYASAPAIIAAAKLGIPCAIHEQNAIPGRANLFLSKRVDRVFVSFPGTDAGFANCHTVLTGLPVRDAFIHPPTRQQARDRLDIAPDARVLLITGGSQGALALNKMVWESLPALTARRWTVLHLCGQQGIDEAGRVSAALPDSRSYRPVAFTTDMAVYMAAADVALSRSGASSVAELACIGLPSILIPYPYSPTGDQKANAARLADVNAAIMVEQQDLTQQRLLEIIDSLSPDKLNAMSTAARSLAMPDAADRAAAQLIEMSDGAASDDAPSK